MTRPEVTIIFPTFNGWEDTKACLKSIRKLNYLQNKLEVIIVDNGSTDGTIEKVQRYKGAKVQRKIKLIQNRTNLGFAKAVNQGAKKAKGEYLLITNNDIIFEKNCLKELVKTLSKEAKIGVVGGRVYCQGLNKICVDGFRLNPYLGYHQFDLSGLNRKREGDWISGNCFLVRRKLFLDFGGFDEEYFFYFEDIDFCLRAKKAGFKLLYAPRAVARHGYGKTIFKEKTEKIFFLGYCSRWRCLFKNASPLQIITSSMFLLLFSPFYQSFLTRQNIYQPMLRGLWYNLSRKWKKDTPSRILPSSLSPKDTFPLLL